MEIHDFEPTDLLQRSRFWHLKKRKKFDVLVSGRIWLINRPTPSSRGGYYSVLFIQLVFKKDQMSPK